ncbi:MAG: TIGR04141 family sporadically distributed protein [Acidiferrobacteraceae bacterium]
MTDKADPPVQGLTIFLLKEEASSPETALQTEHRLDEHELTSGGTHIGNLYVQRGRPKPARWARFFEGYVDTGLFGQVSSTAAVLVIRSRERMFAITFGHGRHLLNADAWEERFGLRVALNSIRDGHVRSIEKRTFDAISRHTREQASREATAKDFAIDVEQDLLRAITGTPGDSDLGRRMSGMDALQTSVPANLESLPALLSSYYDKYLDNGYKAIFPWVDHIAEVSNRTLIDDLDGEVINRIIADDTDRIWMAVPEVTPWEQVDGFRWPGRKAPRLHDVTLDGFVESLSDVNGLVISTLKQRKVECVDHNGLALATWSAYRCLYAELDQDGDSYLLSGGRWYRLTRNFVDEINEFYRAIPRYPHDLPPFEDRTETAYNARVADLDPTRYALMDRKMVRHGGVHDQIEFCDLLIDQHSLVHIKRYGASSKLSHLFSQGLVAGVLFLRDAGFRRKVNVLLPDGHKLSDPTNRPNPSEYNIVFAVISAAPGDLDLPFFSRLNLKHTIQRLTDYNYRVSIAKIPVSDTYARTKRYN